MRYSQWRWSYAVVTTERIAGKEIEPLGIVEVLLSTVHAGSKDIMNQFKNVSGWRAYFIHGDDGKPERFATDKMVKERRADGIYRMQ